MKTLLSYSEGFVFVASGVIVLLIAFTMIARRQRFERHGELHAVPRTWAKIKYVITSEDEEPSSAETSAAMMAAHQN